MNRLYLSIFLLCCAFVAEAQQRYFEIEVRQPARVQLPEDRPDVRSLLVVNNAAIQPASFGHRNKRNDEETGSTNIYNHSYTYTYTYTRSNNSSSTFSCS